MGNIKSIHKKFVGVDTSIGFLCDDNISTILTYVTEDIKEFIKLKQVSKAFCESFENSMSWQSIIWNKNNYYLYTNQNTTISNPLFVWRVLIKCSNDKDCFGLEAFINDMVKFVNLKELQLYNDFRIKEHKLKRYMLKIINTQNEIYLDKKCLSHSESPFSKIEKMKIGINFIAKHQEKNVIINLHLLNNIDIRNIYIKDITCLRRLKNLRVLNASQNKITDITCLRDLKKLRVLNASQNKITDITCLRDLKNLRVLNASYNKIKFICEFNELVQLHVLDLNQNEIEIIQGLCNLKNLVSLNLRNNKFISMELGLEKHENLELLDIGCNKITKIEGLFGLTKMKDLILNDNRISEIHGINNLQSLVTLNLRYNNIGKIENIDNLILLRKLDLCDNSIVKIEGLTSLVSLESLNLCKNEISKLEGLDNLKKLTELQIQRNNINEDTRSVLKKLHLTNLSISIPENISKRKKFEKYLKKKIKNVSII